MNIIPLLCPGEHYFARYKYKKDNLGTNHSVNKSREEFGFIMRELAVLSKKTFQSDRKLYVTATNHVLNFKFRKFGGKT